MNTDTPRNWWPCLLIAALAVATTHAATHTVTTVNDSGAGSLRQALLSANSTVNVPDIVQFNIAGAGPHTINPLTPLPTITDPVTIDGYSQSGASANTLAQGDNAVLKIVVLDQLVVDTTNSTVRGLAVRQIQLGTAPGPKGNNVIEGNFIGLDATGTNSLASAGSGVFVQTPTNRIGGVTPGARNLISGHGTTGMEIFEAFASGNLVQGNYIGSDRTGAKAIPNTDRALVVNMNAFGNTIGGAVPGAGNLISGNLNRGITLDGFNNVVRGNFIGTDVTGLQPLGNARSGIEISGPGNTVGGTNNGAGNVIAFNGVDGGGFTTNGVDVAPGATGYSILGNSIFDNAGLGIDVNANGLVTAGYPVLTLASNSGAGTVIRGTHTPSTAFRLELFSNAAPDPSGYGEGRTLLASTNITTDGSGVFNLNWPASLAPGVYLTATASGATEFSQARMVVAAGGTNRWTNSLSGKWESGPNWSLNVAPYIGHPLVLITNAATKTVTSDATTASAFPTTLTLSNLLISAPAGATNTLLLAHGGTATPLTIRSNFTLNSGGALAIQNAALRLEGPVGTALRIDGSATLAGGAISVTNNGTQLIVGNNGRGAFSVSEGTVRANYTIVGANSGSDGTWRVAGGTNIVAGGAFDIADSLTATGTVVVTGGRLEVPNAYVGLFGNGRLVVSNGVVEGAGTVLIGSQVGAQGSFIAAGGASTFGGMLIRESPLAAGSVLVTGDAQVRVNGPLDNRGAVTVSGGSFSVLGQLESEAPGNSITVNGGLFAATNNTAHLTSVTVSNGTFLARDVFLGNQKAGTFTVAGGLVALPGSFNGFNVGVNGGTGTLWQTGGEINLPDTDLNIGGLFSPAIGRMAISNGATYALNIHVGGQGGGTGVVSVAAGTLASEGLFIGGASSQNQLIASNAATVLTGGHSFLGLGAGANSNSAAVSGPGTHWLLSSNLYVGSGGASNRLVVGKGAAVLAAGHGFLGANPGANANFAMVADPGSRWVLSSNLYVGSNGALNRLVISNGAAAACSLGALGNNASSTGNVALVTGPGSVWSNTADLNVGRSGAGNQLVVSNGGTVRNLVGYLGVSDYCSNNAAVVTGAGSFWSNAFTFVIGASGSGNRLVVSNGAVVRNNSGHVGLNASSSNNVVLVTDSGSAWSTTFNLSLGQSGAGNQLVVSNGGVAFSGNGMYLGFAGSSTNNRIVVNGGTLRTTNSQGISVFDIRRGTNVLMAGMTEADRLLLTNALGFFEFKGGTLLTGGTTNGNGRVFTVGNGTNAATLRLRGGAHVFSNNLVVASNAVLAGTGTVIAGVTNAGMIAPGASAGSITITGPLLLSNSSTLHFELGGTTPGSQYDQINLSNTITYAGAVNVQLINGFTPSGGQVFQLIQAPSRAGAFAGVNLPALPAGLSWTNRLATDGSVAVLGQIAAPQLRNPQVLANGSFQFAFTNAAGAAFTVFTTTNVALPLSNWTALGPPTEPSPGQYQFTDPNATNQPRRFYHVRSP
ncbi:MAG TPA: hypothetical protein P5205_11460 [Candidatus Paceibacterota bacterium]|nr:hypothetical protein [Verrucomicrobiota bacterium]HSA10975.1 hypothetical protein [Candidatus Paceibacterota bacterium]